MPSTPIPASGSALNAYEALAPYYDNFTRGYAHGRWLTELERWAVAEGLRGQRLLDVACGTGKSFEPLLRRGYRVTACDLSPEMVSVARHRADGKAEVVVADMRALPWRRSFDLVTCLNDAVNYLLTEEDLRRALTGMADVLCPGGIAMFDANSLMTYRTAFAERMSHGDAECLFEWEGFSSPSFQRGEITSAGLTMIHPGGACRTDHVQRHWPLTALRSACKKAGFDRIVVRGQLPGARLVTTPDEEQHSKLVFLAVRAPARHARPRRLSRGAARRSPGRHGTWTSTHVRARKGDGP